MRVVDSPGVGGMYVTCVTKKTLAIFFNFSFGVLSQNVGDWCHVLFMGVGLVEYLMMWILVRVLLQSA